MLIAVFIALPTLVVCSTEGNIHLLEEEVAAALRGCIQDEDVSPRYIRSNRNSSDQYYQYTRIDSTKNSNPYNHERRNTSDVMSPNNISTITDNDLSGYDSRYDSAYFYNGTRNNFANFFNNNNTQRTKRNEKLVEKYKEDQCLSQCVFANLHMVDSRGIPREVELWNKIEEEVTSQQSRLLLQDQIRSCFQEIQSVSEYEDSACSTSNKLERCLMLRFSDRIKRMGKKQS